MMTVPSSPNSHVSISAPVATQHGNAERDIEDVLQIECIDLRESISHEQYSSIQVNEHEDAKHPLMPTTCCFATVGSIGALTEY